MKGINEDWRGFVLINPFHKIQLALSNTPELFIGVIVGKTVIPDSTIEPERRMELDGLLVTLGYGKKISWEIPDWEIPTWFLTYIEDDTPKEVQQSCLKSST